MKLIVVFYLFAFLLNVGLAKKETLKKSFLAVKSNENFMDDFGDFNMDDLILNDKKPSVKTLNSNDKSLTNKVKNNVPPKVVLNRKVTKLKITSNYPKKVAPKIKQKEKQIPKK